jgi:DNA-binding beta-propeller fold protein YncE
MTWGLRVSLALCVLGCATTARASYMFAVKSGNNTMDILSTLDGSASIVANSSFAFNALTPAGQTLLEGVALSAGEHIITFNTATDTATDTGVGVTGLGSNTNVIGVALAPGGGTLYAVAAGSGPEHLYAINTTTGVATDIGSTVATASDIAFDPINGKLYAWVFNIGLSTINTATGAVTDVGVGDGLADIQAIAFDSAGNLYGARNALFSINPNDGTYTTIATMAGSDIRGLAFADTPEPGTFGIAALGCLAIAIARRRRRMLNRS